MCLVKPWFEYWRDAVKPKYPWRGQTSLIYHRKAPKLGIYRTQIRPIEYDILAISGIAGYQDNR